MKSRIYSLTASLGWLLVRWSSRHSGAKQTGYEYEGRIPTLRSEYTTRAVAGREVATGG